jgi:soluble lytic murein transglycosylase-like protein
MDNASQKEKVCVNRLSSISAFMVLVTTWLLMIFVVQVVVTSPLESGSKYNHIIFHKSISTFIKVTESLPDRTPKTKAIKVQPAIRFSKREHLFHPIIEKVANRHEIDPALVKAIIMAESGYNPKAISKRGAKGLMQLMPSTAKSLGVEDIFNPEHNIKGGVIYFKRLVDLFEGDVKLALAAYNAGVRKVKKYQGIPPFKATRYYIKKVFKYYEYYRQQMAADLNQA